MPTNQTPAAGVGIVDRIRAALAEADGFTADSIEPRDYQQQAAAVLRIVADAFDQAGAEHGRKARNDHAWACFALMENFHRAANEAEMAATPCDFVQCDPGGEPCLTHERLMAHADGEHELCEHAADGSAA